MPKVIEASRYTVGSVSKALRLLDVVARGPAEGLSLSELSRMTRASKSTTYGLVRTLVESGYLRVDGPGPRYVLGIELVRLGDVATRQVPLARVSAPVLQALSRATGLTIRIAVVEDGYPVFVDRIDAVGAVRFHTQLGVRELPHTSAAGKAILAELPEDEVKRIAEECGLPRRTRKTITDIHALETDLAIGRRRGYAVDDEEDVEGVFCVAAAFFDHSGVCAGAISATGLKLDLPAWRLDELGHSVRASAAELTRLLGGAVRETR
jgi:IclR family acetate operon transcriptional repressor